MTQDVTVAGFGTWELNEHGTPLIGLGAMLGHARDAQAVAHDPPEQSVVPLFMPGYEIEYGNWLEKSAGHV